MKLRTHPYFIITCITLLSYGNVTRVHAQETKPVTNELDAQYTPTGSGILSSSKSNADKKNSRSYDYPTHIVKITPGLFIRSIVALQYEYHMSDNTSLCGGVGFNYNKDILFQGTGLYLINELTGNKAETNEIDHFTIYKYGNFGGSLPYLYGGVKFCNSDGDGYFEINYSRYGNGIIYTSPYNNPNNNGYVYNTTIVNDNTKVKFISNVFGLKFGTQHNTESKIITTHEFYVTLGLNVIRRDVLISTTAENSTQGLVVTYTKQNTAKHNILPFFNIGYSFGIGM
jgi:hypothetical protein